MEAKSGATLTELLAVVLGMGCLATVLVPALLGTKDAADRTICAANLARLGHALAAYAADYDGLLPDCGAASQACGPVPADGLHYPSRTTAAGTCNWPNVRAVGNQANLWLLVRGGYALPRQFICPATADRPSLNSIDSPAVMGFVATDPATGRPVPAEDRFFRRVAAGRCSYSYQNQFVHPGADPRAWDIAPATTHLHLGPPRLAVLADRNPYTRTDLVRQPVISPAAAPEANSPNHHGQGQNVLFLGGEVEWHETPRCGIVRPDGLPDNIYWPDAGMPDDPLNFPRSAADAYLVP